MYGGFWQDKSLCSIKTLIHLSPNYILNMHPESWPEGDECGKRWLFFQIIGSNTYGDVQTRIWPIGASYFCSCFPHPDSQEPYDVTMQNTCLMSKRCSEVKYDSDTKCKESHREAKLVVWKKNIWFVLAKWLISFKSRDCTSNTLYFTKNLPSISTKEAIVPDWLIILFLLKMILVKKSGSVGHSTYSPKSAVYGI